MKLSEVEENLLLQNALSRLGSEGNPIPLVTETTIPKSVSSFPAVYAGQYPANPAAEQAYHMENPEALLPARQRQGIQKLQAELKNVFRDLQSRKPVSLLDTKKSFSMISDLFPKDLKTLVNEHKRIDKFPLKEEKAQNQVQKYLAKIDQEAAVTYALAKLITEKTQELSTIDILVALRKSWAMFLQQKHFASVNDWSILIDTKKIGSEWWLLALLTQQPIFIPRLVEIIGVGMIPESQPRTKVWDILLIDDVLFSGQHIMGLMDEWLVSVKAKKEHHPLIQFHIIVPFLTKRAQSAIQSMTKVYKGIQIYFYPVAYISTIKQLLQCYKLKLKSLKTMEQAKQLDFSDDNNMCSLFHYIE